MVQLSILVPAADTQPRLDNTLVSLLENRPSDCEVVLVHPESYVDPYDLQDEVRLVPSAGPDALTLVNDGVAACRGEWIHVVCPGVRVQPGWCEPARDAFQSDGNLASIAPQLIVSESKSIHGVDYDLWRGKKSMSARSVSPVMPTLSAGFYQASAFRFMRGFDRRYGPLAEVELGFRLRAAGYKTIGCSNVQVEIDREFHGQSPRGFRGGQLRAALFQSARRAGRVSGGSYVGSLSGEFRLHAWRPSVLTALAGHASAWFERPGRADVAPFVPREATVPPTPRSGPELRKAG